MPIKAKRHIKRASSPVALEKKVIRLEGQVKRLSQQICYQRQRIKGLVSDKKTLTSEVATHKKNHTLAKQESTKLKHDLKNANKDIADLKEALRIAMLPKNSYNSSLPPSTDIYKPKRNTDYSLREKTGRKSGGQPGHKGCTLEFCTDDPDEVILHAVEFCTACGKDLSAIPGEVEQTHQVVDIVMPKRILTNHTTFSKVCSCGHCNKASFPNGAKGPVNYGVNVMAVIVNMNAYQYMPYKRSAEFMEDIVGIHISQGTVRNLLTRFEKRAQQRYNSIQDQVGQSPVVGADETGAKVDGGKGWFHVYQTPENTFIGYHPSRGKKAQEEFYPVGFPESTLVHDCYPMQMSTPAKYHQACHPHLGRELNAFDEAHPKEHWPGKVKEVFRQANDLEKPYLNKKVEAVEKKFEKLIKLDQSNAPGKIPAFCRRMNKHNDKIFTFLHIPGVPSDNNASERAIRGVKVKQKVSGQFKTSRGAHQFAMNRSIIDTDRKQDKRVHENLVEVANFDSG